MNTYQVNLIGDISAAGAAAFRNELCNTLGNLYIVADEVKELAEGLTAATQQNVWQFVSPYQFDLPATNAFVVYRQLKTDTVATQKLTSIQKNTVITGDVVFLIAPTILTGELNSYTYMPVLLSATTPQYFQVGQATDSQSSINATPYATAIGKAYFSRAVVMATLEGLEASKAVRQMSAINLVQQGQV